MFKPATLLFLYLSTSLLSAALADNSTETRLLNPLPKVKATTLWPFSVQALPLLQLNSTGIYVGNEQAIPLQNWALDEDLLGQPHPLLLEALLAEYTAIYKEDHLGPVRFDPAFNRTGMLLVAAAPDVPMAVLEHALFTAGQVGFTHIGFLVEDPDGTDAYAQIDPNKSRLEPSFKAKVNSAPVLHGVVLVPSTIRVGQELKCHAYRVKDVELDQLQLQYQWTINGMPSDNNTNSVVAMRAGDQLQCSINATDGMSTSGPKHSDPIVVNPEHSSHGGGVGQYETRSLAAPVNPNCIDRFDLHFDSQASTGLPPMSALRTGITESEADLHVDSTNPNQFESWTTEYFEQSKAGSAWLAIPLSKQLSLENYLQWTAIWAQHNFTNVILGGHFGLDAKPFPSSYSTSPKPQQSFVLKHPATQIAVQEGKIVVPTSGINEPLQGPSCIGSDGVRYANEPICANLYRPHPGCPFIAPKEATVSIDKVSTMGSLQPAQIEAVLASQQKQLQHCFVSELKKTPELNGDLTIEVRINGNGIVDYAAMLAGSISSTSLRRCITRRLERLHFPVPINEHADTVSLNLQFTP